MEELLLALTGHSVIASISRKIDSVPSLSPNSNEGA